MSKGNGKRRKTNEPTVRAVYDNMIRIMEPPPPKLNETPDERFARFCIAARRIAGVPIEKLRIERTKREKGARPSRGQIYLAAFSHRWGYATRTLRAFFAESMRRRPTERTSQQFFVDLRKYGCVQFDDNGALIRGTLDCGPDPYTFSKYTPAGTDRPRE